MPEKNEADRPPKCLAIAWHCREQSAQASGSASEEHAAARDSGCRGRDGADHVADGRSKTHTQSDECRNQCRTRSGSRSGSRSRFQTNYSEGAGGDAATDLAVRISPVCKPWDLPAIFRPVAPSCHRTAAHHHQVGLSAVRRSKRRPRPDPIKEDKKKREYLSLFATNVAFTSRKGDEAGRLAGEHRNTSNASSVADQPTAHSLPQMTSKPHCIKTRPNSKTNRASAPGSAVGTRLPASATAGGSVQKSQSSRRGSIQFLPRQAVHHL